MDISTEQFGKILSLNLSTVVEKSKINEGHLLRNAHLLDLLDNLQRLAGSDGKKTFHSKDLRDAQDGIMLLSALMSEEGLVYLAELAPDSVKNVIDKSIRVINKLSLGGIVFGYFGEALFKIHIDGDRANIRISSLKLKSAEIIGDGIEDFEEFKRSLCVEDKDRLTFSAET